MDSQIEEIKNKLNVVDIIGSYLKLTKTGANFRGVCPFHSEKSPSFFVSPGRQMWHCFGCGSGSSIFDFVMKIEGVEFGDALRILANKAGVELKRENIQLRTERQRLYEICELACKFFEKQLEASATGKEAQEYLFKRGITGESLKKWRVGWSPDTWNGLSDFLISKGYSREEIIKAGLAIEKEGNKADSYDRFRGRIMFPVFDLNSQVVGYGGRVFLQQNETAKYINTPQTLLYDKSGVIYGLNNAKLAIRKQNQCVVTEGYTDVIMCHQAGYENTVAASGTALTQQHLVLLKRYSENLVLAFDMDVAGDSATKRGINLAQEQGFNIKIIEHYGESDKKSDPAEIILKNPAVWQESVQKAKSIMDYYVDSAFTHFDKTTSEGKKEIGKVVLPAIKRLTNKIEQSHWIQKLAEALKVSEEVIIQELEKINGEISRQEKPMQPQPQHGSDQRKSLLEQRIMALEGSEDENDKKEFELCVLELEKIGSKRLQQKMMEEIAKEQDDPKKDDMLKEFEKEAKKFHSIK
ncbi:MAG: DNA primase [Candidatus Staskawiczbacteria bacterium]|nr:DNA primase [Candidatus Staskawiczbacteria bacterium]